MFTGAHVIIYSTDAEADRALLSDVLGWQNVDAGGGWLIFKLPPAEVAVHPTSGGTPHELYLTCKDIDATCVQLAELGIETSVPVDEGWGILSGFTLPGGAKVGVYQPRHPLAFELD